MPRDINGNYTLPAGNPVVPQTIIETDWANPTMEDIAQALTQSLSRTGQGGMLVPFLNADGSANTPGISWANEPTSGFYRLGAGSFGYAVGTVPIFTISAAGITMAATRRVSVPDGSTGQQAVNFNQLSSAIAAIEPFVSSKREQQIAIAAQTVFNLTTLTYIPNVNNLAVYMNGLRLFAGDYTETNGTTVTLTTAAIAGDVLLFVASESLELGNPVIIDGGTIDNTVIGGTTPAAGTFTSLGMTGSNFNFTGANLSFVSAGGTQLRIVNVAGAVNYPQVFGAVAGGYATYTAEGTDPNINVQLLSKGAGVIDLRASGGIQFRVNSPANAVNYFTVNGSAAGSSPWLSAGGENVNASLWFVPRGTGGHTFFSSNFASTILSLLQITNAVNFLQIFNNVTGQSPILRTFGTDANIGIDFQSRGTGVFRFFSNADGSPREQFRVGSVANSVNFMVAFGGPAGASAGFGMVGADANVGFIGSTKGIGAWTFNSHDYTAPQFRVNAIAGAVNFLQVSGSSAATPILGVTGSATDANIGYATRGIGQHLFYNSGGSAIIFAINATVNAVNYLRAQAGIVGNPAILQTIGPDADIDLQLVPRGAGFVRFGGNTATADAPVVGYITIRDAAGTLRKLAVIA